MIDFTSVYNGGWNGSPYWWSGSFPVAGGSGTATDIGGGSYSFTVTILSTADSNYATHGDYVAAMGAAMMPPTPV